MNKSLSVAGIQFAHQPRQRKYNLTRAKQLIASFPGHDIYVLPELSSSGYGQVAFDSLATLAESTYGPSFVTFSKLAKQHNCFICYSFPRRISPNKYTISAAVVNRKGKLETIYDKWHICQIGNCFEKDYFVAGSTPLACFEVDGIAVGVCICYDIRFPEMTRKLVLDKGIAILLHLGSWPRDEAVHTWHTFVITRALENSIYIMSVNRAGEENGCSIFCPPFVDSQKFYPQILGKEEGFLIGEVNLQQLETIRNTYTFLKDRRADLYQL